MQTKHVYCVIPDFEYGKTADRSNSRVKRWKGSGFKHPCSLQKVEIREWRPGTEKVFLKFCGTNKGLTYSFEQNSKTIYSSIKGKKLLDPTTFE